MPKKTAFYLQKDFILSARRNPSLIRREIDRILLYDPEGERLPYEITRYALAVIGGSAIIVAGATAPGLLYGIRGMVKMLRENKDPGSQRLAKYKKLRRAIEYVHEKRYIEFIRMKEQRLKVQITDRGKARLLGYVLEDLTIPEQKKWDKKWRMVIFDIPEEKKVGRDVLRRKLRDLGFFQLQRSVFVSPYPCEREIDFITEAFGLWSYVTFIETDSLGRQEAEARERFDL